MRAPCHLAVVLIAWPASVSGFEPAERYVTTPAPCLRHAELSEHLRALAQRHGDRLRLEEIGSLFQQRTEGLPPVRHGQPVSLLLVSPAPEGRIDFADARLARVWLDGYEVGVSP